MELEEEYAKTHKNIVENYEIVGAIIHSENSEQSFCKIPQNLPDSLGDYGLTKSAGPVLAPGGTAAVVVSEVAAITLIGAIGFVACKNIVHYIREKLED